MKQSALVLVLSAMVLATGLVAHAEDSKDQSHPCMEMERACKAAGFERGAHKEGKGKGLHVDCMKKLMDGQSVEGVTVPADVVSACKAKKEAHHHGK